MKPRVLIRLDAKTTESVMSLIENLEDLDDVTNVWLRSGISDELLAAMAE